MPQVNPTLELEVMSDLAAGLRKFDGDLDATRRALQWAISAFLPDASLASSAASTSPLFRGMPEVPALPAPPAAPMPQELELLPDLYSAASPTTDAERVLVVGYWFQQVKGEGDLDSFSINKELKHLGYPVSNMTTAFRTLMERRPQLVIQTRKSGASQQARKLYRLTSEGIKTVQRMLTGND